MKGYERPYPGFSLCGLQCGLCPIHHMAGGCPGCGGGAGHQPCPIVRCSQQHEGVEYCFQCPEFPCAKYGGADEYDSFVPHRNRLADFARAKELGLEAYRAELEEKAAVLRILLERYNDGRRKSFFCTAVNLLALVDVRAVMEQIAGWQPEAGLPEDAERKQRAAFAAACFQEMADKRDVSLKLRKKPRAKK